MIGFAGRPGTDMLNVAGGYAQRLHEARLFFVKAARPGGVWLDDHHTNIWFLHVDASPSLGVSAHPGARPGRR